MGTIDEGGPEIAELKGYIINDEVLFHLTEILKGVLVLDKNTSWFQATLTCAEYRIYPIATDAAEGKGGQDDIDTSLREDGLDMRCADLMEFADITEFLSELHKWLMTKLYGNTACIFSLFPEYMLGDLPRSCSEFKDDTCFPEIRDVHEPLRKVSGRSKSVSDILPEGEGPKAKIHT